MIKTSILAIASIPKKYFITFFDFNIKDRFSIKIINVAIIAALEATTDSNIIDKISNVIYTYILIFLILYSIIDIIGIVAISKDRFVALIK
ncbi:MAG TPA: hypothetical protein PKN32_10780 [Bacteroidales bacterium]|nr:hypothetical protein [Bacteroidales bacterium]